MSDLQKKVIHLFMGCPQGFQKEQDSLGSQIVILKRAS